MLQVQSYLAPAYAPKPEREESWQENALCVQTDPDLFFPEHGHDCRPAIRVCAQCPVVAECREYCDRLEHRSVSNGYVSGVFGGESPEARISRRRSENHAAKKAAPNWPKRNLSPTTPFRCERCNRLVRPKLSTEQDFPGTVSAWGSRLCSTCGRNRKLYR